MGACIHQSIGESEHPASRKAESLYQALLAGSHQGLELCTQVAAYLISFPYLCFLLRSMITLLLFSVNKIHFPWSQHVPTSLPYFPFNYYSSEFLSLEIFPDLHSKHSVRPRLLIIHFLSLITLICS